MTPQPIPGATSTVLTARAAAQAVGVYHDEFLIGPFRGAMRATWPPLVRLAGIPAPLLDAFLFARDRIGFDDNAAEVQRITASYLSAAMFVRLGGGRWILPNGRLAPERFPINPPEDLQRAMIRFALPQDSRREETSVRYSKRVQ